MNYRLRIISVIIFAAILGTAFLAAPQAQEVAAEDYSGHVPVLAYAEIITDPLSGEAGRIDILRQDLGNGQLSHDFVYNDPRRAERNGGNAGVTYAVSTAFQSRDKNLTNQIGWMYDSIFIWNGEICADLTLSERAYPRRAKGVVDRYFETGNIYEDWVADLTQIGFLSAREFSYFAQNTNVLGVTFTLFWGDENGNLTDIDNNGKFDVAFREIYYNDEFEWADTGLEGRQPDGTRYFDFPTVAIHEAGHGVSAAHFGTIGIQDGALVANPRTIMNAIYGGTLRTLAGHDHAGTCNNWAQWPIR